MGQWIAVGVVAAVAWLWPGRKGGAARWLVWGVASLGLLLATAGAYELRKTVAVLLMPMGLLWMGTGYLAAWLGGNGDRRVARRAWVLFAGVTVMGNVPLGVLSARLLEARVSRVDPFQQEPFDVVVVLGGGLGVDHDGRPLLGWAGERVALAARMYHAGRTPLLVASGPVVRRGGREISVAEATCAYWRMLGVPGRRTLALTGPRTTREEIQRLAREASARRWRRIGLVSSAWHLPRAGLLAARAGLQVVPLPADRLGVMPEGGIRYLVPQGAGLLRTEHVAWEVLGMAARR